MAPERSPEISSKTISTLKDLMDQKTTYEQLITEKLEGMPVPDMADAIWARIETQLDLDMPTDDGGSDPAPDAPSGSGWVGGAGLFAFVVALVTLFIINKNHKKKEPVIPSTNTTQKINDVQNSKAEVAPDSLKQVDWRPQAVIPENPVNPTLIPQDDTRKEDTIAIVPQAVLIQPFVPDTIHTITTMTPPKVNQDTVKPKKSRGVPNITDNDYRIVPVKKDSARGD